MEKKTKIVATLGPATDTEDRIERLIEAGVDVFRLNFSHGQLSDHRRMVEVIRAICTRKGRIAAILGDLPGPKLRIGEIAGGEILLEDGSVLMIKHGAEKGTEERLFIQEELIFKSVRVNDLLFLNDGLVRLKVKNITDEGMLCRVEKGGFISSRKGLNIPFLPDNIHALTEQDRTIVNAISDWELDFLALSFVRSPNDLLDLRNLVKDYTAPPALIAKIEKPQALQVLDSIIQESDGIMVARGDLGVEIPIEQVPFWQKKIIWECRKLCKPVIVATQMLESMIHSPMPTRAEVNDVAGAIYDGTDAVMLSGETAIGEFPVECVTMVMKIARFTEGQTMFYQQNHDWLGRTSNTSCAVAFGAVEIANKLNLPLIVTCTYSGSTARRVSRFRPCQPILALSPMKRTLKELVLCYGVKPRYIPVFETQEDLINEARSACIETGLVSEGKEIVITAGVPLNQPGFTNFLQVQKA